MSYSLSDITASIAEVQRTLVSLTDAVASTVARPPQEDSDAPPARHQQQRLEHESLTAPDPSTVPEAPIQVVRNMHSWITGQRPDGKSETAVRRDDAAVSLEASSEGNYVRS
jgi:hypothetical protein